MLVKVAAWARYAYFLRFSLMLWLFPPLLCLLNVKLARTLTSGIVTPETWGEYTCVAFFLLTGAFVALIIARVVVANGLERFEAEPPPALKFLLANNQGRGEWAAVLVSQIPTIATYIYFWINSQGEAVDASQIATGLVLGSVLAIIFWGLINAAFYLAYTMPAAPGAKVKLGENAARTILFPRTLFGLVPPGRPIDKKTLEGVRTPLAKDSMHRSLVAATDFVARIPGTQGYLFPGRGFYEGHVFSAIAICGFICLYLTLWPVTAPVPLVTLSLAFIAICTGIPALILLLVFWTSTPGPGTRTWNWRRTQLLLSAGVAAFLVAMFWLYLNQNAARFPTLALLLIIMTLSAWALSGVAFFLDRYRIPVLTAILAIAILPRMFGWVDGKEEHYISAASATSEVSPPSPQQILDFKSKQPGNYPLIVVTATGGGLHASAWTATVLSRLELEFKDAANGGGAEAFHKHILLASTVSGGSVGLLAYLREIEADQDTVPFDENRVENAAQCSSLEAVGWGLAYYDLPKAFLPILPYFISPSSGIDDLDDSPLFKDRTWALRKGFARNLHDGSCQTAPPGMNDRNWTTQTAASGAMQQQVKDDEQKLTLSSLLAKESDATTPAFTMNTTTVEGGTRFLLANYQVPRPPSLGEFEPFPAQSFLYQYDNGHENQRFDLPLVTAAQLSATFPFVSSSARIPVRKDKDGNDLGGYHFVDGGYYDNDGTSSAIEFLRSALQERAATSQPLRIILVEIRNSGDPGPGGPPPTTTPWNLLDQPTAVLQAFWNSGHESTTPRNRVGLDQLMKSYPKDLQIERVVFDDEKAALIDKTDPLNWALTPRQRREVKTTAEDSSFAQRYTEVKQWFYSQGKTWPATP